VIIVVDTNVLVRYLTWDDTAQAEAAAASLESADTVAISTIVLCELAWVLRRAQRYKGEEIADAIRRITESRNGDMDRPSAEAGLRMLRRGGDFTDGIIQSDARRARCRHVVTFDKVFAGLLDPDDVVLLSSTQPD
jgi:predicted nucleic-acid-binding protein